MPWRLYLLRWLGIAAALGYVFWNLYWLCQFRLPPSIFKAVTGYPCPTTGASRSFQCLLRGDWQESLRFNAMTVPIIALFVLSLGLLAWRFVTRQRVRLPMSFFWAWVVVLLVAWVLKLTGDPLYW